MSKVRPLSANLQEIAIAELNEVPERLDADIEALRIWIEQQPHLNARTDDQFLVTFLRGCKFSLERAKSKIDNFYTLRTKYPESFTIKDLDDPRIIEIMKLGVGVFLPTPLNDNGPRLLLIRGGIYPANKYNFAEIIKIANALQVVLWLNDDYAVVNGILGILDMSATSASHMLQMTPTLAKRLAYFAEEAVPIRQKGSHLLGLPKSVETIFNTIRVFMPEKHQNRLHIHSNKLDTLYEHIPKKYLPKEYGGENGSIPELIEESVRVFHENYDLLREENTFGTIEKLRQGNVIDFDTIFGIDGSFRQLNVD